MGREIKRNREKITPLQRKTPPGNVESRRTDDSNHVLSPMSQGFSKEMPLYWSGMGSAFTIDRPAGAVAAADGEMAGGGAEGPG